MKSREKANNYRGTNFKAMSTGIFCAVSHPTALQIAAALSCDIAISMPIVNSFELIDGEGNMRRIRKKARRVAREQRHNVICSIGTLATDILQSEMQAAGNLTPIIMADISCPLKLDRVTSTEKLFQPRTTVSNSKCIDLREHMGNLFSLAYDVSRILVIGDLKTSSSQEIYELQELEAQIEDRSITVDFFNTNPLQILPTHDWNNWLFMQRLSKRVNAFAPELIVLTRDEITASKIDLVLAIAQTHRIPVFATDMASVKRGAAVGYGFSYDGIGAACARIILDMAQEGVTAKDMPSIVYVNNEPHLWVNKIACSDQNLAANEQKMAWLREKGRFV